MKKSYSFLKDELALMEIRKHKWIESEKLGREVGFATAAVDWVRKYGPSWKRARLELANKHCRLSEKRVHRRFSVNFPVQLFIDKNSLKCQTKDISLGGLSCTLPDALPPDSQAEVTLLIKDKGQAKSRLQFKSRVARVSRLKGHCGYEVFFPFSEDVRDYLRANAEILNN